MADNNYISDINAGWNWIVSGGSSVAAKTTHRSPGWVIPPKNSFQKPKDCVAFNSNIKGHVPGYTGYVKGADNGTCCSTVLKPRNSSV